MAKKVAKKKASKKKVVNNSILTRGVGEFETVEDIKNDPTLSEKERAYLISVKDPKQRKNKWGKISDEEARFIERNLPLSTYKDIALQLGRKPETVRKWAQRHGITLDKISRKKTVLEDIKKDDFFKQLEHVLTEDEMVLSHKIYLEMCNQFGNDIKYTERQEIIDHCVISCSLLREQKKEKLIEETIYKQEKQKLALKDEKDSLSENDEDDDTDYEDKLMEDIEDIEISLADLKDERRETKIRQDKLLERKEKSLKSMNASRQQRSDELTHSTKNFSALTEYLQKNVDYRRDAGYALEKMKLGIDAEWYRLSEAHKYADGSIDYPLLSAEVVQKELDREKEVMKIQESIVDNDTVETEDELDE